jgi:predicted GNAT superfamily acetyltransferase
MIIGGLIRRDKAVKSSEISQTARLHLAITKHRCQSRDAEAMQIRRATVTDFPVVLALNAESVARLSPLDESRLAKLHAQAALHRVVEHQSGVIAFLLALREGADYDSPNYVWFAQRYPSFLYIDRVVVSMHARGKGAGALLYRDTLAFAAATSVPLVACEYDIHPPNPASELFHAKFGFREVGSQSVAGGAKVVSLQAVELGQSPHWI